MYLYKSSLILATNASLIDRNLAICYCRDDDILADSLAVIHDSYVNVVPVSVTSRRAKYVPIFSGNDRGKGTIKQVRWVEINQHTFFVVVSTNGLQVYDTEISNVVYHHGVRETGDESSYAVGICVVKNLLCIGTHYGTIWMFQLSDSSSDNEYNFKVYKRVFAHDEALQLMESMGNFLVTSSDQTTYMWNFSDQDMRIVRKFDVMGMQDAKPTVICFKYGFIITGYTTGEICIFDVNDEDYCLRNLAHKLGITGMDFSSSFLLITVSDDCYIKAWKYEQKPNAVTLLQTIFNEEGPVYGVGFLNFSCTEFCTITGGDTKVKIYIIWDENTEDFPEK